MSKLPSPLSHPDVVERMSPDYSVVFANEFSISVGTYNAEIAFGHSTAFGIQDGALSHAMIKEWRIALTLPPTVLKELAFKLTEAVAAYEDRIGDIPDTRNFNKP